MLVMKIVFLIVRIRNNIPRKSATLKYDIVSGPINAHTICIHVNELHTLTRIQSHNINVLNFFHTIREAYLNYDITLFLNKSYIRFVTLKIIFYTG